MPTPRSLRITHLINDLDRGGAQIALYRLLSVLDPARFHSNVISMTDEGPVAPMIARLGIPTRALGMGRGRPDIRAIIRLSRVLRAERPDGLQTWLYQADLLGGLAARVAGGLPVVWSIHQTTLDPAHTKLLTRMTVSINSYASRWLPDRIVLCAQSAAQLHRERGYAAGKLTVIPNGFTVNETSAPDRTRVATRLALSIPPDALVVGRFARYHPDKDYSTLMRAAAMVGQQRPNLHFILCGDGVTKDNDLLSQAVAASSLGDRVHLLGPVEDLAPLYCALDVSVSSSSAIEAFPLVVGEAMAEGVPCVVTDVGDSALLVGNTGRVVPPRDPGALACALDDLLSMDDAERRRLGRSAQQRIAELFPLNRSVDSYASLYEHLAAERLSRFAR